MIDEKKLIEELREYEDELYDLGELTMMSGVSGAISIVKNQLKLDGASEKRGVKMKYPKEEILNALKVIQNTCREKYEEKDWVCSCYNCPFSDPDGHCIIAEQSPMSWDIKNDEPWRAFE